MIRMGLCCLFAGQPIRFRTTTARTLLRMTRQDALKKIAELCLGNAKALQAALEFCSGHDIGAFRITSRILPLKTHPEAGYRMDELPGGENIAAKFRECGDFARKKGLRLLLHPDQFILLGSPGPEVTERSLADLEYHGEVAEWTGADVIILHGGGGYGDRDSALGRVRKNLSRLSDRVRNRLAFENDDRIYTPSDLLSLCRAENIPLVYDVHHHHCLPDNLDVETATEKAIETWNREPVFHISSPKQGWHGPAPRSHHDYIDPADFPEYWMSPDMGNITVEVEAKAREMAVLKLAQELRKNAVNLWKG